MLIKLFLLFVGVPLLELALLLMLADYIGWQYTLLLVVLTGVAGSLLVKTQGWFTYRRIQKQLAAGQLPGQALLDGALIFFAGALLLTPGMLTDVVGFFLLLPAGRRLVRAWSLRWFQSRFQLQQFRVYRPGEQPSGGPQSNVIDSHVVDREPKKPRQDEQ